MSRHGEVAVEMLRELKRSKWLPPYNEASMRKVVEEMQATFKTITVVLASQDYELKDVSSQAGVLVMHQELLRNKRCALAYLMHRVRKICALWWDTGSVMPAELKANLSLQEIAFFEGYDKLMGKYMQKVDLNLAIDQQPPKALYVEVRVLKEYGPIMTDRGVVNLKINTQHYLRRTDAELLIRQGVLEQTEVEH